MPFLSSAKVSILCLFFWMFLGVSQSTDAQEIVSTLVLASEDGNNYYFNDVNGNGEELVLLIAEADYLLHEGIPIEGPFYSGNKFAVLNSENELQEGLRVSTQSYFGQDLPYQFTNYPGQVFFKY